MRIPLVSIAAVSLLAAGSAASATPDGATELARALEGREAGEPVECINLAQVRNTRVIEETAIVYRIGSTLYVNRPRAGADALDRWDTQVTRTPSNRLCSTDTVRMIDPNSRILRGTVFLGQFVPYRRIGD